MIPVKIRRQDVEMLLRTVEQQIAELEATSSQVLSNLNSLINDPGAPLELLSKAYDGLNAFLTELETLKKLKTSYETSLKVFDASMVFNEASTKYE